MPSASRIRKFDDIVVIAAQFNEDGTFFTHWPVWDGESFSAEKWDERFADAFVAYAFFTSEGLKKTGINYSPCKAWTDSRITRKAVSDILSLLKDS